MSNLLNSASIVLTPTAYDNGSMLSVKPNDGDGDFDFSRNSAATRVNAQGLVENVQILSGDLVSNGDFSQEGAEEVSNGSFSQEGAELITNGDFATDTDWQKGTGTTISGGQANFSNAGGVSLYQSIGNQGFVKVTFDVTDYTSGTLNVYSGGSQSVGVINVSANALGTYTTYVDRSGGNANIIFGSSDNFNGSIDNVSVKEVGQDWTLGTGWSIGEDKAVFDDTTTNRISQTGLSITSGKSYKINFTIADCPTTAHMTIYDAGGGDLILPNENYVNGSYTRYYTATTNETGVSFWGNTAGDTFSITNISVKEVGQDWTLGTGWSVGSGLASKSSGTASNLFQSNVLVVGLAYKVTFTLSNYSNGNVTPYCGGTGAGTSRASNGTFTEIIIALTSTTFFLVANSTFTGSVTNISVVEITDDTNLPRINYEGFSYQDSLGSELVFNGDFATDSANWFLTGSSFWVNSSIEVPTGGLTQGLTLENNKTYKITFDVIQGDGINGGVYVNTNYNAPVFANNVGVTTTGIGGTYTFTFTMNGQGNGITLTRRVNDQDIRIDNVSVKEYLGQEVVPDSGCGSWLLEPQSTNLLEQSEDLSNSYWTKSATTISANYATAPNGLTTADKIVSTSATGEQRIYRTLGLTTIGNTYTYQAFVKADGANYLVCRDDFRGFADTSFDLVNGVVGTIASGRTASITPIGDYYLISVSTTITSSVVLGVIMFCLADVDNGRAGFVGDGTKGIVLWGAMLEQQSYATSYIPTNGATSTRLQDIANNSGNATLINSTEGVLYAEIAALSDDLTFRTITLSDGTTNNNVGFGYRNNSNVIYTFLQGVINSSSIVTVSDITSVNKVAIKYKSGDFSMFVNGIKVFTSTTAFTLTGLNELAFDNGAGAANFHGKAKALVVYKEALTDEQLICLTTI